jgi:CRISPR-associated protein Cas2
MYDIENDKSRTKIAKYLEQTGLTRLQYSLFIGKMNFVKWQKTKQKIEKIFNQYASPNDKLYIQNIDENNFEKMEIMGNAPDIDFILHKQKVLYIG